MPKGTLYVALALGFLCRTAVAQTVNGAFHGTATDASGAVMSDAVVEVTNLATQASRSAKTDAVGYYTIPQLPPGHYSVAVCRTGFAKVERPDVQLQVNQDL